jgi:hypothetical protein
MGWLSDAYSSVCSVVSSAASWAVSGLSSAASYLGGALSSALSVGGGLLGSIGNIASGLLQGLGIFKKDERPEDIGDRAMQAHEQGVVPEKFDNFSQYMESLRSFDLDPQKTKETTTDQKIFKGLEVGGRALEDKYNAPEGSMANVWVLAAANPEYFTADRFQSILGSGMDIPSIVDYFEGKLGSGEALEIEDDLVDIDQHANPGKDENTSRHDIYAVAEAASNIWNGN